MRCSGAKVFLTPSHVKESFTAAIVVRSLLAALGEVWVVGLLVIVDRLVVCGLVVGSVVVAVDIGCAESPWVWLDGRPGSADWWWLRLEKTHWLLTVLKAYDGRSAIEVTGEPSVTKSWNQGARILDEREDFYRAEP